MAHIIIMIYIAFIISEKLNWYQMLIILGVLIVIDMYLSRLVKMDKKKREIERG